MSGLERTTATLEYARLGEGTGAVLVFPIIDAAVKIFEEMATFQEGGISVEKEKSLDPEAEAKVFNDFWKRRS